MGTGLDELPERLTQICHEVQGRQSSWLTVSELTITTLKVLLKIKMQVPKGTLEEGFNFLIPNRIPLKWGSQQAHWTKIHKRQCCYQKSIGTAHFSWKPLPLFLLPWCSQKFLRKRCLTHTHLPAFQQQKNIHFTFTVQHQEDVF